VVKKSSRFNKVNEELFRAMIFFILLLFLCVWIFLLSLCSLRPLWLNGSEVSGSALHYITREEFVNLHRGVL
jgi:hypothetical protein